MIDVVLVLVSLGVVALLAAVYAATWLGLAGAVFDSTPVRCPSCGRRAWAHHGRAHADGCPRAARAHGWHLRAH